MKEKIFSSIGDFVLAVIRKTRRPPRKARKHIAPAGVSVKKVSDIVSKSPYSFEEYVSFIKKAISSGDIVLIVKCSDFSNGTYCKGTYNTALGISDLSDAYDFTRSYFTVALDQQLLEERSRKMPRYVYHDARFYIAKDGLPKVAQDALNRRQIPIWQESIASDMSLRRSG